MESCDRRSQPWEVSHWVGSGIQNYNCSKSLLLRKTECLENSNFGNPGEVVSGRPLARVGQGNREADVKTPHHNIHLIGPIVLKSNWGFPCLSLLEASPGLYRLSMLITTTFIFRKMAWLLPSPRMSRSISNWKESTTDTLAQPRGGGPSTDLTNLTKISIVFGNSLGTGSYSKYHRGINLFSLPRKPIKQVLK